MTGFWTQLVGVSIADRYPLEELRSSGPHSACFRTRRAEDATPAVVEIAIPGEGAEERLKQWDAARELSHPNLVRIFETGRSEVGETALAYAVMEYPEDELSAAVQERRLTAEEAREVLAAILEALQFLHGRGFVHGGVEPRNIVAAGGVIKLSSDSLSVPGESDGLTPADDIRDLGFCLCEILTQRRQPDEALLETVAAPFPEIIRGCLASNPEERWSVRRIAAAVGVKLEPAAVSPKIPAAAAAVPNAPVAPGTAAAAPEAPIAPATLPAAPARPIEQVEQPAFQPRVAERRKPVWQYLAGFAAVLVVIAWLARPSTQTQQASQNPPVAPPAAVTPNPQPPAAAAPAASEAPKSTPAPEASSPAAPAQGSAAPSSDPAAASGSAASGSAAEDPEHPRIWRVIAFMYTRQIDARREVSRIRRKWPQLEPEIFSTHGDEPPFLVSLGGRMTHDEAVERRSLAVEKGLPEDIYVQNYTH